MSEPVHPVRVRTARARSKARDQLRELLRDTSLVHTLVIASDGEGAWTVLAGGMEAKDMGRALLIGTEALKRVTEHEDTKGGPGGAIKLDRTIPVKGPMRAAGRRRDPEIKLNAEGELQAPPGEAFTYCAECGAARWYITTMLADDMPGRYACVFCGNEVKLLRMQHAEGRA